MSVDTVKLRIDAPGFNQYKTNYRPILTPGLYPGPGVYAEPRF